MFVCRVCLEHSDKLISLESDRIDALPILHMLNEFTIINAEPQLPKYICDNCTNKLDIAYVFKRQYENSIVRFIRRTSYQHESSTTDEDSVRMSCKSEECEQEQDITMQIRVRDLHELSYTVSTDSWVEYGIDIEDMDTKLRLTEMDTPPPAEESMNDSDSYNQAHEETGGHSNEDMDTKPRLTEMDTPPPAEESMNDGDRYNQTHEETVDRSNLNESNSARSDANDKLAPEMDETVQEPTMLFKDINVDYVETKYVSNYITPCASPSILLNSTNDDLIKNQRIDDFRNANLLRYELTNNLNENEEENRPTASKNECSCLTCCSASDAVDASLECSENRFRVLRSNRISNTLTRDILSKIYTEHRNRPIKPYRCDVCFRWFKTKGHIKAHRMRHIEGEKRIKCRKCRLTFLTKPHLRNHKCLIKFY